MDNLIKCIDLGLIEYKRAWDIQKEYFNKVVETKNNLTQENIILLCEHPHVYTLGKSGDQANLLIDENFLKSKGASFIKTDRGGDITYHGPGQIVGYPILNLERINCGIKDYIFKLEEAVIQVLQSYDIPSSRLNNATGVWLDVNNPASLRKICAIGVKASRYVTMHGFAFNINTDLNFFNFINPCGFVDKGVTSLEKELNKKTDMNEVKTLFLRKFFEIFNFKIIN